jgi:thiamine kinase-like enzyme
MEMTTSRYRHKNEVNCYLKNHVSNQRWQITLPPHGTGHETYFMETDGQSCFVKLGAISERYQVMSELGLSPAIVSTGYLEDGTSILVQQRVDGRKPSRKDFHLYLKKFAESIKATHQSGKLKQILPAGSSPFFKDIGLETLTEIERRWKTHEQLVPAFAGYVNEKISWLKTQLDQLPGSGLVASHNDVCNGNWLVTPDEKLYLLDLDSMSLDDPALDLGAILWWYYPPELRGEFLETAGYPNDEDFHHRMRIRMAIHNLNIVLPREGSFDRLTIERFEDVLEDFRALIDGQENPKGYRK